MSMTEKVKQVETLKELSDLTKEVMQLCKDYGLDLQSGDFAIVQPYAYNEGVLIQGKGDGTLHITAIGPDSVFVLPKKKVSLDIYNTPKSNDKGQGKVKE